jgi:hypothetical protein
MTAQLTLVTTGNLAVKPRFSKGGINPDGRKTNADAGRFGSFFVFRIACASRN